MSARDLHDRYTDLLLDDLRSVNYPSKPMLDRCEAALHTVEHAEQYVETLFEKVDGAHPSGQLLDRLSSVIDAIERHEQIQQPA